MTTSNNKPTRLLRLSKGRIPSFSSQKDWNLLNLPLNPPITTPVARLQEDRSFENQLQSTQSKKHLIPNPKPYFMSDKSVKVLPQTAKPIQKSTSSQKRIFGREILQNELINSQDMKLSHVKTTFDNNISKENEKSNVLNVSKISNIPITRGSDVSERSFQDSDRANIPVFGPIHTEIMTTSPQNFADVRAHINISSISNPNISVFEPNVNSKTPQSNNQRIGSRQSDIHLQKSEISNQNNTIKSKLVKIFPAYKVIDLTETKNQEKEIGSTFEARNSALTEKTINIEDSYQDSNKSRNSINKDLKDIRVPPMRKTAKDINSLKDLNLITRKSHLKIFDEPVKAKNTSILSQKNNENSLLKDGFQENNSPKFEESPIKINPIRTFKKANFQEKPKENSTQILSHDAIAKSFTFSQLKNRILDEETKLKKERRFSNKQPVLKKLDLNKRNGNIEAMKSKYLPVPFNSKKENKKQKLPIQREKDFEEYLADETILKTVIDYLCIKSLCLIPRISKKFRQPEILNLMKKAQCKLLLKGLNEEEQYNFWDLHVNFGYLQTTFPLQFTLNAMKASPYERDVLSDIDRTRFFNNSVSGQESLLRILLALSNSIPKIGYVQGMNVMGALILATNLKDSEAYWLLRYIMTKKRFEEVFLDGFPRVQHLNYQLDIYARNYIPELMKYLEDKGINIGYLTTQWFITMFSYDLELHYVVKIWNLFFVKGWKTLIRVALSLLWHFKDKICKQTNDDLPEFLKHCIQDHIHEIPEDELFKVAFSFKVSNRLLKGLEILYEHSAPSNLILVLDKSHHLEWKIITENPIDGTPQPKDIIEYLNENLDQIKSLNKMRGDIHSRIDNYRSVQTDFSSLIVDKSLNMATLREKSRLDFSTELKSIEKSSFSKAKNTKSPENTFFQTLSEFGKRIRQIWTPKDESLNISQAEKCVGEQILTHQLSDKDNNNSPPISERHDLNGRRLSGKNGTQNKRESQEHTDSTKGKRVLANVLRVSTDKDILTSSVQPFSPGLVKEEKSFHYEKTVVADSTIDLFAQLEKEMFHAPKKTVNRHRKNTSLTQEFLKGFKGIQPVEKYGLSARGVDKDDSLFKADVSDFMKSITVTDVSKVQGKEKMKETQGLTFDLLGSKIKPSRDVSRIFKEKRVEISLLEGQAQQKN